MLKEIEVIVVVKVISIDCHLQLLLVVELVENWHAGITVQYLAPLVVEFNLLLAASFNMTYSSECILHLSKLFVFKKVSHSVLLLKLSELLVQEGFLLGGFFVLLCFLLLSYLNILLSIDLLGLQGSLDC